MRAVAPSPARPQPAVRWPGGARFALFLSHDIDQIYEREIFRILGDVNHLRRMWLNGEPGSTQHCLKRIVRSVVRPQRPDLGIETILDIERAAGFRSTFFLLEDQTFNKFGGRYMYADPAVKRIVRTIESAECEVALHGAYPNLDDAEAYRAQARAFEAAFGRAPRGIRNHYLRHDGVSTWRAQREAGFVYDSTFGSNDEVGPPQGWVFPFAPFAAEGDPEFVVIPMTIMDVALFGTMRATAAEAWTECMRIAESVIAAGGTLVLNWHNTYFEDPEYQVWRDTYETLLGWLAGKDPWNATGEELAGWWMRSERDLAEGR